MKLTDIKGIGQKKEEKLNSLGIFSLSDLLNYFPKRYEDRSNRLLVKDSIDGLKGYYELEISGQLKTYFYQRNKSISNLSAFDQSGQIKIVWYNDRFTGANLQIGQKYKFFGSYNQEKKALINPIVSKIDDDRIGGISPIYSANKGISSKELEKYIKSLLDNGHVMDDYIHPLLLQKYKILPLKEVYELIHRPKDNISLYSAWYSYYLRDLMLDKLAIRRLESQRSDSYIKHENVDLAKFLEYLPFSLTDSQLSVLSEIMEDMSSDKIMNRIVIGDVGSGKTILAILAAIFSIKNGYQVAFMAPTEILAGQHYSKYKEFFEKFAISSCLLTGSNTIKEKKEIYGQLKDHKINIIFGTHSLIQEKIDFSNLGLVVIDEQQRFGVNQRRRLFDKGGNPDTLLLSATPIPRTLALALYDKIDISYIETLPKGRLPIISYLTSVYKEKNFMNFAYNQIMQGRQVYVIATRVEEDESLESVEVLYKKLNKYFAGKISIDFLHGQMSAEEKEQRQEKFVNNKTQMLIATSIVEVGIDVPNASTIIIYDAQQFGLSQLHQLRGRVGRSSYQSYCFFVVSDKKYLNEKLEFITDNLDGFEIAKKDLEIRGAGEIYGRSQSGYIEMDNSFFMNEKLVDTVNQLLEEKDLENPSLSKLIEEKINKLDGVILN